MKGCNIMLKTNKSVNKLTETRLIEQMRGLLDQIYSNKSSTEYKCHGDITLVPEYNKIEQRITDLKTLLRYPQTSAASIRTMFNTLHKPVFKQMVTEYINEPNDRNTTFTLFFTVGFRVLVGELARIYAATVATEKGLMYKPDKVSKNNDMATFIKSFNESIEKKIDDFVRDKNKESTVQEGFLSNLFGKKKKGSAQASANYQQFVDAYNDPTFKSIIEKFKNQKSSLLAEWYNKTHPVGDDWTKEDNDGTVVEFLSKAKVDNFQVGDNIGYGFATVRNPDEWLTICLADGKVYYCDDINPRSLIADSFNEFLKSFGSKFNPYLNSINVNEYYTEDDEFVQEGVLKDAFDIIGGEAVFLTDKAIDFIKMAFRAVSQVNPISMVNAILSSAYDRKVAKFDQVSELYEATKEAYNEYLKLPDAQRKAKIESRYKKNIEKYNIKMNNLWAAIEHYDQRAVAEANDRARNSNTSSKPNKPSKPSTPSGGNDGDGDIDF